MTDRIEQSFATGIAPIIKKNKIEVLSVDGDAFADLDPEE